ncbi:hypothetical protein CRG98_001983 [Punica granatum]|uniref:Uncharacterized protein n=1 Tax=Punica granatum TaxID=22663 RepID=A0A2I0LAD3_PUNGR|nr:hypothetical protein CRG98_001983 [Punica granatum]
MRQWEIVLGAGSVEIAIVDTDSDFPILLFHWDDVHYPFKVIAYLQESRIHLLDDLLFNAEKKVGSLTSIKARPDPEGARFFFDAYVYFFGWLDGGELVVFKTVQTLPDLGHVTVLVKPFPEVYGLGLSKAYFG